METVTDQFFLGPDLVVAPVLRQAAITREVHRPEGTWRSDDGSLIQGPTTISVATPLDRIPRFARTSTDIPAVRDHAPHGGALKSLRVIGLCPDNPAASA